MKNTIRFINDTEAQVSKAFQRKAAIYGTDEFKLWRAYCADFPGTKMVTKSIKKNPDKVTYKNLTYKNMELYIKCTKTGSERDQLLAEFKAMKESAAVQTNPYRCVLAWFLQKFEDYDSYKQYFEKLEAERQKQEEAKITPLPTVQNEATAPEIEEGTKKASGF